ncbi:histidine phosphatase family protein [Acidothermaceae bacterium B102]|nr:histidine phosphatase family protein [Acidothermaceae bacterium B102]
MRLILVRHGQSPSNIHRLLDTAPPGPPLTELGLQQAAALPAALADQPVDLIYASTLIRAQMTAGPLAASRGLKVVVRDGLREVTAGDLEMKGDDDSVQSYLRTLFAWAAGDLDLQMPGGDTGVETFARYDAVVAEAAAATSGAAVLVSHGAIIRMWVGGRAMGIDAAFVAANTLGNTGVVVLDGSPANGWVVDFWTDRIVGGVRLPGVDGPAGQPVQG